MASIFKIYRVLVLIVVNFVAILVGFFLSINLSTVLGQTGDWGVFSSGLLVAGIEVLSKIIYRMKKNSEFTDVWVIKSVFFVIGILNNVKIGLLYGFFVEAFKLGS